MTTGRSIEPFCYDHPRPAVTVDIVIVRHKGDAMELLLIRRKSNPFAGAWALPGGYVEDNESLECAAHRELLEETGIAAITLSQFAAFGDPGRDPRGHTVSIVFQGEWKEGLAAPLAGDDAAETRWFNAKELPELAFDHARILQAVFSQSL